MKTDMKTKQASKKTSSSKNNKKETTHPRDDTQLKLNKLLVIMGRIVTVASFPLALEQIMNYIAEFGRLFVIAIHHLIF